MQQPTATLEVPRLFTRVARSIHKHPQCWIRLGNLESALLAPDLADIAARMPLYVCGLARAGSTLLLEVLAAHSDTASHRYEDFPFIFTPYWWKLVLKLSPFKDQTLRERAHGDGMMINAASPEAMEEMLWMAFFPHLHDASRSNVLDAGTTNPAFERFYRKHVQKILLAGRAARYVSKGNYNVTRMDYLRTLFTDARFVVPVREPAAHIASLMRQHRRFSEAGQADADVAAHMSAAGHFEFGLNRTPIHTGDDAAIAAIQQAWANGNEVLGWALYWNAIYRFVIAQLEDDAKAHSMLLLRYETLCHEPANTLRTMLSHCQLAPDETLVERFAATVKAPDYYESGFTSEERTLIASITNDTAKRLGY